jgi:hypothetical protein
MSQKNKNAQQTGEQKFNQTYSTKSQQQVGRNLLFRSLVKVTSANWDHRENVGDRKAMSPARYQHSCVCATQTGQPRNNELGRRHESKNINRDYRKLVKNKPAKVCCMHHWPNQSIWSYDRNAPLPNNTQFSKWAMIQKC